MTQGYRKAQWEHRDAIECDEHSPTTQRWPTVRERRPAFRMLRMRRRLLTPAPVIIGNPAATPRVVNSARHTARGGDRKWAALKGNDTTTRPACGRTGRRSLTYNSAIQPALISVLCSSSTAPPISDELLRINAGRSRIVATQKAEVPESSWRLSPAPTTDRQHYFAISQTLLSVAGLR
jgi:hypothetical protein